MTVEIGKDARFVTIPPTSRYAPERVIKEIAEIRKDYPDREGTEAEEARPLADDLFIQTHGGTHPKPPWSSNHIPMK